MPPDDHNNQPSPLPKGVRDILPEDQEFITYIKKVVRHRCRQSGYRRISTPIFEFKKFFEISLGHTSKIVKENLYLLKDRDGNDLAMRPEGTTGVIRSYVANKMFEKMKLTELFYIEPYFEFVPKVKKPFFRSYLEFGAEAIGEADPAIDAQVIFLAYKVLQDLSIPHLFSLQLNNLGCKECFPKYQTDLQDYFIGKERSLCFDCQESLKSGDVLGILRCTEEDCRILVELSPKINLYWCLDCQKFFTALQGYLQELAVPFTINDRLVGQYDYYNRTIFKFWDLSEKEQNVAIYGGRYDNLIEKFGAPSTPAVGFSMRLEKIVRSMKREKIRVPSKDDLHVFIAQLSDEAKKKCLRLLVKLRDHGIKSVGILGKGSIREQVSLAEQFKVPYTIIMGLTEVRENVVILRDMKFGTQKTISYDHVLEELTSLLGEAALDKYSPGELLY